MNLNEALTWAEMNTSSESVKRLRSRAAVKALADEVCRLRVENEKLKHPLRVEVDQTCRPDWWL